MVGPDDNTKEQKPGFVIGGVFDCAEGSRACSSACTTDDLRKQTYLDCMKDNILKAKGPGFRREPLHGSGGAPYPLVSQPLPDQAGELNALQECLIANLPSAPASQNQCAHVQCAFPNTPVEGPNGTCTCRQALGSKEDIDVLSASGQCGRMQCQEGQILTDEGCCVTPNEEDNPFGPGGGRAPVPPIGPGGGDPNPSY